MKPILRTKGIYLDYNHKRILTDTNIEIYGGEVHALVGNHDEGKTFLCKVLCGLLRPTLGYITGENNQIYSRKQLKKNIEVMWEGADLFERMTVAENIVIGTHYSWHNLFFKKRTVAANIAAWLQANDVQIKADTIVETLSSSDKIFICLLRCLYRNPKILLLDSALSSLPPEIFARAQVLIRKYLRADTGVLWVTHDLESTAEYADRVSILRRGHILLTEKTGAMERLNLLELCYAKLESNSPPESKQFHDMLLYFEALLEQLPLSIIILNNADKITFANSSAKTLFDINPLALDQDIKKLLEDTQPKILQIITDNSEDIELPVSVPMRLNNQSLRMKIGVHNIHDKKAVAGRMIILEDVTITENLREKISLAENISSLGLLSAGISHEINNSLNILASYIAFLGGKASAAQRLEAVQNIREEINEIKRITGGLRTFSGSDDIPAEVFDCTEVINNLVSILGFEAKHNRIDLVNETPDITLPIRANKGEIRQVLLNLVRNSFESIISAGRAGRISFQVRSSGGSGIIILDDNGIGIKQQKTTDIFLPFSSTKKGCADNQGLGLSIAYGIIKRYNGNLTAKNLPEHGCRFTIELPLVG